MAPKKEKRISRRPFIEFPKLRPTTPYIDRTKHRNRIPIVRPLIDTLQCKAKLSDDKETLILEAEDFTEYRLEPMRKLKRLIEGRTKITKLTLIIPSDTDFLEPYRGRVEATTTHMQRIPISTTRRPRRFVRTDFPLTREEKYLMRDKGIFPIEEAKGETTRLEALRLDTETENQLRLMMLWHKEKTGKEPILSDLIRLCIHREFVRQEQQRKDKN